MKIIASGDLYLGDIIKENNSDQIIPLEIIRKLKNSDLTFCNLESPITLSNEKQKYHYSKILNSEDNTYLKTSPENVKILKEFGFNIVSIANNHILDYGYKGLFETIRILKENEINYVGANNNLSNARKPFITKKEDTKLAFLAYSFTYEATRNSPGCSPLRPSIIKKDIKAIRNDCDFIVISLHYGEEYNSYPRKKTIELCHNIIDNGADIILGHHPHILRAIELYKNGLIAYSLGDFLFNFKNIKPNYECAQSKKTCETILLEINIKNKSIHDWKIIPLVTNNLGFPTIPSKEKKDQIIKNLDKYLINLSNQKEKSNFENKNYYLKRVKKLLKIIMKSFYYRNFQNIYLILLRIFKGI